MSIGESLYTESMSGSIRMIDKGTDGTAAMHYCQSGRVSDPVWKTGCSTVVAHIAFLREWVARLHYGLSEIVDGEFIKPSIAGRFEFTPILVAHAPSAVLLDYLNDNSPLNHDTADLDYCSRRNLTPMKFSPIGVDSSWIALLITP